MNWRVAPNWQRVAEILEEEIVSGAYAPGEQIKQGRICERFGVSVATAREALRHLESAGLLFLQPNRGVFVADVSTEELLRVLLPTRLTLERFAIEHTLAKMTPARWQELWNMVRVMEAGAEAEDLATINEADIKFHKATVLWSDQPHTVQLWNSVEPRTRAQMYRLAPRHQHLGEVAREHAYLLEQFQSGDPALIAAALEDHVVTSARALLGRDYDGHGAPSRRSARSKQAVPARRRST